MYVVVKRKMGMYVQACWDIFDKLAFQFLFHSNLFLPLYYYFLVVFWLYYWCRVFMCAINKGGQQVEKEDRKIIVSYNYTIHTRNISLIIHRYCFYLLCLSMFALQLKEMEAYKYPLEKKENRGKVRVTGDKGARIL